MRKHILYTTLFSLLVFAGCENEFDFKKTNIKAVTTLRTHSVGQNSAMVDGRINTTNDSPIEEQGVYYSTHPTPTYTDKKASGTKTENTFSSTLTNLTPNTLYYARAYAKNSYGIAYGEITNFTTLKATLAKLSMTINKTTSNSVDVSCNITDEGGYPVTEKGFHLSSSSSFTNFTKYQINPGGLSFSGLITSLKPGTTYYIRPYAITLAGLSTGASQTINTLSEPPGKVSTKSATNITINSATSGGSIGDDGGSRVTSRGISYSATSNQPTITNSTVINSGEGTGEFESQLTGLKPNTTYYVRSFATNSVGTTYGQLIQFRTLSLNVPSGLSTYSATSITRTSAQVSGAVSTDGGSQIISRGICFSSTTSSPTIANSTVINSGSGTGNFTVNLSDLKPGTTYYVRTFATNSVGTSYGPAIQFRTLSLNAPSGLNTDSATNISSSSAQVGGTVSSDGGSPIISRGICFSSISNSPTIANSTVINSGSGTGSFTAKLSDLKPNTTYYARSFATNSVGTSYGNVISFKTLINLKIGDSYQGGIIAYILQSSDKGYKEGEVHGLIIAAGAITRKTWGCVSKRITTPYDFGTGMANTIKIVNECPGENAARYTYNLNYGGYSDWYLPSFGDIGKIVDNNNWDVLGLPKQIFWVSSSVIYYEDSKRNFGGGMDMIKVNGYGYSADLTYYVLPFRNF